MNPLHFPGLAGLSLSLSVTFAALPAAALEPTRAWEGLKSLIEAIWADSGGTFRPGDLRKGEDGLYVTGSMLVVSLPVTDVAPDLVSPDLQASPPEFLLEVTMPEIRLTPSGDGDVSVDFSDHSLVSLTVDGDSFLALDVTHDHDGLDFRISENEGWLQYRYSVDRSMLEGSLRIPGDTQAGSGMVSFVSTLSGFDWQAFHHQAPADGAEPITVSSLLDTLEIHLDTEGVEGLQLSFDMESSGLRGEMVIDAASGRRMEGRLDYGLMEASIGVRELNLLSRTTAGPGQFATFDNGTILSLDMKTGPVEVKVTELVEIGAMPELRGRIGGLEISASFPAVLASGGTLEDKAEFSFRGRVDQLHLNGAMYEVLDLGLMSGLETPLSLRVSLSGDLVPAEELPSNPLTNLAEEVFGQKLTAQMAFDGLVEGGGITLHAQGEGGQADLEIQAASDDLWGSVDVRIGQAAKLLSILPESVRLPVKGTLAMLFEPEEPGGGCPDCLVSRIRARDGAVWVNGEMIIPPSQ